MHATALCFAGVMVFLAPEHITHFVVDENLTEIAPDGKPWPTCKAHLVNGVEIRLKGTPQMILTAWFGAPERSAGGPPPGHEPPEQSRIVRPGGPIPGINLVGRKPS